MSDSVGMSGHAIFALFMTVVALALFTRERIRIEYSCLAIMLVLVLGFELFPLSGPEPLRGAEFLRGFGNDALLTICLLVIAVKAVEVSGALRPVSGMLVKIWSLNRAIALPFTLLVVAFLSAFFNNTPIVVMLMPILIGVAHRVRMAPSRVLMPFCFATTLGGMTTTIGSSTNLLVVGVAEGLGVPRIGMFDFFLPAAAGALVGIAFLAVFAPRLLVDRPSALTGTAPRIFYAVIRVHEDSVLVGQTLADLLRKALSPVRIEGVQRRGLYLARLPSLLLQAGDTLHMRGSPEAIKIIREAAGDHYDADALRRGPDQRLVEVVVTRTSPLYGKRFSELYRTMLGRLYPVGLQSHGPAPLTPTELADDPRLREGDVLLMEGHGRDVLELKNSHNYIVLDRTIHVPRTRHAVTTSVILCAAIVVAALGLLPILVSVLCGVCCMLLTRCIHWDEAWRALDTRLVVVIVTSLALGTALYESGATEVIAYGFVAAASDLPEPVILSGFLLIVAVLNEFVSNNAVAVIGTPIAVSIAEQLGVPAMPYVLAVLFGANIGFVTPIGYQTNLIVFTSGGYKFSDFFRVGLPLLLLVWLALSILLSALYL